MGKRKAEQDSDNPNSDISRMLLELAEYERNVNRQTFKYNAYRKAAGALIKQPKRIKNGAEAQKIEGIGKSIGDKIDEILKTGHLQKLETIRKDDSGIGIAELMKVSGIGPVQAKKLLDDGIKTIEDLKEHEDKLNRHQKIGLKYVEDFQQRIPRNEMQQLEKFVFEELNELDKRFKMTVCGSYRRESSNSGDIDILLTHDTYETSADKSYAHSLLDKVVKRLTERNFIIDMISQGDFKFAGVCRLLPDTEKEIESSRPNRRIDIRLVPTKEYWCGVLYFTGSDEFNRQMRHKANEAGFTISEYSIRKVGLTGQPGQPLPVDSEKDIFDYIDMKYVEPKDRNS